MLSLHRLLSQPTCKTMSGSFLDLTHLPTYAAPGQSLKWLGCLFGANCIQGVLWWDMPRMLTNRLGCPGVLNRIFPGQIIQPITSLIIQASLPEMTRVLLGALIAFHIQGVQYLDAPWLKSVPSWMLFWCTAPRLHLLIPVCPHHVHGRSSTQRGMAHPSRAASCLPKVHHQFKGRT